MRRRAAALHINPLKGGDAALTAAAGRDRAVAPRRARAAFCRPCHSEAYFPGHRSRFAARAKVNRRAAGRPFKPAIASGCDPIPFRTWKSNLASLSCY